MTVHSRAESTCRVVPLQLVLCAGGASRHRLALRPPAGIHRPCECAVGRVQAGQHARGGRVQEKEAGAAAYKAREFDTALGHFTKAWELYDQDVSFLTNRAAVHMEKGDLEEAMKDCQAAVDAARQIMPVDFKIIAKCAPAQTVAPLACRRSCAIGALVVPSAGRTDAAVSAVVLPPAQCTVCMAALGSREPEDLRA